MVRWCTTVAIEAEEQSVTSANSEQMRRISANPDTRRLLGVAPELDGALKLDRNWAFNVVKALGNHGETYNRTMGPDTLIGLESGSNEIWTRGGLLYALPMR